MRFLIILFSGILGACSLTAPKPENNSGLGVKIKSVKNHSEGVDVTVVLDNTTKETMGLSEKGSVSVLLDGKYHVNGTLPEEVEIPPGRQETVEMEFHFINEPRLYKSGLIEMIPTKNFRSCEIANRDPEVVPDDNRDVAVDHVEPLTCNRPMKMPIRIAF